MSPTTLDARDRRQLVELRGRMRRFLRKVPKHILQHVMGLEINQYSVDDCLIARLGKVVGCEPEYPAVAQWFGAAGDDVLAVYATVGPDPNPPMHPWLDADFGKARLAVLEEEIAHRLNGR